MMPNMSDKSLRIAVVEDDVDLLDTTLEYLRAHDCVVWGATSAEEFYRRFAVDAVDLVVLDIGLPGEDGLSVAHHLRELPQLTVIIVSARTAVDERLAGLRAGADRYLVKPVDLAELLANINAVNRRLSYTAAADKATWIQQGQSEVWHLEKLDWRLVAPDGKALNLTSHEYVLLSSLFEAKGEIVAKQAMADQIFGARTPNGRERLDVQLARLRKKGKIVLNRPLPIKTVHQMGYIFTAPMLLV